MTLNQIRFKDRCSNTLKEIHHPIRRTSMVWAKNIGHTGSWLSRKEVMGWARIGEQTCCMGHVIHGGTVSMSKWPWRTTETENDFLKAYVKQVIIVSFISVELLMQSLKSLRLSVKLLHIQEEKSWSWNNSSPKNSFQTHVKSHQDENKHFICSAGNSFESCSVSDGV